MYLPKAQILWRFHFGFDLVVIIKACVLLGATSCLYPSYDGSI